MLNNISKKRKRIAIALIILVVLIFAGLLIKSNLNNITVNLGESVTLHQNQTIQIKNKNVSVKITNFINDTCPSGAECIWSGQSVEYEIDANGHKYTATSLSKTNDSNYDIETVKSDYKTYADIIITAKQ